MAATSRTVIRMWTQDGYHKDVAVLDSDQVRITDGKIEDTPSSMYLGGDGPSVVVNPADYPEAVRFQVIVTEYRY